MAKPLKYTHKITVMFTEEQFKDLKDFADKTGDGVSTLLRRLALKHMADNNK